MKCYYHIDDDAVGMCARCGKALCSVCAEDVGGALLCPGCIALAQEEERLRTEQEGLETKAERNLLIKSLKKTMLWSWIVTAVLGCITIAIIWQSDDFAASDLGKLAVSFVYIYLFWSWYWGVIFIRERWGRKAEKATGGEHGWILGLILLFVVAPCIGFCGGGIYEYLKYRKIIKQGD